MKEREKERWVYVSSGLLLCDVYIASSCGGVDLMSLCGDCRHKRALSKQGLQVYIHSENIFTLVSSHRSIG